MTAAANENTPPSKRARPIVDLPPPTPEVRDAVARLVIDLVAHRVLVELGVVADLDAAA